MKFGEWVKALELKTKSFNEKGPKGPFFFWIEFMNSLFESFNLIPACDAPALLKSGHAQTLAGEFFPNKFRPLSGPQKTFLLLDDGDQLSLHKYSGQSDYVVVMGHGLTGSAEATYLQRLTYHLNEKAGHTVVCFNHRNCGDGLGLAKGMYHSGRSRDFAQVIHQVKRDFPNRKIIAVGFSMSGNALLRLMGDHDHGGGREFSYPDFAISVNAPVNLARSSRLIDEGFNKIYQANFMKGIKELLWKQYQKGLLDEHPRFSFLNISLYEFDDIFTGPRSGFSGAEEYYQKCSAQQFFRFIERPTVMITAQDDPFVHFKDYLLAAQNPLVHLRIEKTGGHMGYIHSKTLPTGDRRWMDFAICRYIENIVQLEST